MKGYYLVAAVVLSLLLLVSLFLAALLVADVMMHGFAVGTAVASVLNVWCAASVLNRLRKCLRAGRTSARLDGLLVEMRAADEAGNRTRAHCLAEQAEADLEVLIKL